MTFEKLYNDLFKQEKNEFFVYFEKNKRITVSTKEFKERVNLMAQYIYKKLDYIPRDSWVGLKCSNSVRWPITFFAVLKCGYNIILLDDNIKIQQLDSFIKFADIKCIVTDNPTVMKKNMIPIINVNSDECKKTIQGKKINFKWSSRIAYVTSGTTDNAKIYAYNADDIYKQINGIVRYWSEVDKEYNKDKNFTMLQILPLRHVFGLSVFLLVIALGYTVIFPKSIAILDIIRTIKEEKIWFCPAVPAIWKSLITVTKKKYNGRCGKEEFKSICGDHLICGISGGAKLDHNLANEIINTGVILYIGWGMTEVGVAAVGRLTLENMNAGFVGDFLGWCKIRILEEDGCEKVEECGELAISSDSIYDAEINNKGEVKRRNEFFRTGDIFKVTGRKGYFLGRKKSTIISDSGENIYPEEIEEELEITLSQISQKCVFGMNEHVALFVSDPFMEEKVDEIVEIVKEKNKAFPVKGKIAMIYISTEPVEVTSKGDISRFYIKDYIKNNKNIRRCAIMKGAFDNASND